MTEKRIDENENPLLPRGGSASHHVEEEEENLNYDLLEADSASRSQSLLSFSDSQYASAIESFASTEDHGFRTTERMLEDNTMDAMYDPDYVYRCVSAVNTASQNQMARTTEFGLDTPFDFQTVSNEVQSIGMEPQPRLAFLLRLEHTHMYIACPLADLISKIERCLKSNDVDFMYDGANCKWRAMYYPSDFSPAVDFRIYLNSCNSVGANRYLIEFMRRSGCTMAFNQLFNSIREKLIQQGVITLEDGSFVSSVEQLPSPFNSDNFCWESKASDFTDGDDCFIPKPILGRSTSATTNTSFESFGCSEFDEDDFQCSDEELFQPFYDLSLSIYEDVHVQGLSLVATEVQKGNGSRMTKVLPELIPLLIRRLSESKSLEVRRYACSALCGLATDISLHSTLIENGATVVLAKEAANIFHPQTLEIQRQAAKALANFCANKDSLNAVLEAVGDKQDIFEELAKCNDSRLTQSILDVRGALEAC